VRPGKRTTNCGGARRRAHRDQPGVSSPPSQDHPADHHQCDDQPPDLGSHRDAKQRARHDVAPRGVRRALGPHQEEQRHDQAGIRQALEQGAALHVNRRVIDRIEGAAGHRGENSRTAEQSRDENRADGTEEHPRQSGCDEAETVVSRRAQRGEG
jgi:hypothetical protein